MNITTKTNLWSGIAPAMIASLSLIPAVTHAAPALPPGLNELGPENGHLAKFVGDWDVVETAWSSPNVAPKISKLVAQRKMIGSFLQETIRPSLNSAQVLRIDYLSFNRVEGRWKYLSMDTRVPAGLMPAASFGRGEKGRIELTFDPFSDPKTGQLLQMHQAIIDVDANHSRKDQYFVLADGTGKTQLLHRYAYTRRIAKSN
ncbi:DUF1579 domain-containing protein [bacterium]|nr:MAG: DUF1579 domain-containing protein [bacterium]